MQRLGSGTLACWLGVYAIACVAGEKQPSAVGEHAGAGNNTGVAGAVANAAGNGGSAALGGNTPSGGSGAGPAAAGGDGVTTCAATETADVLGIATAALNATPTQLSEHAMLTGDGLPLTLMTQQVGPAGLRWAGDRMFLLTDTGFWEIPSAGPPRWYATATTLVLGVRAGDIDADGDQDLMLMTALFDTMAEPNTLVTRLAVWERTADGLQERSEVLRSPGFALPIPYAFGDIDGDGDLDIAAYEHGAPIAYIKGDAFQYTREERGELAPAHQQQLVAVVDFMDRNADGALDLLVIAGEALDLNAFVLLGDGKGKLSAPGPATALKAALVPHGPSGTGFGIADVTGDGLADVLEQDPSGTDTEPRLLLYVGTGPTTFAPAMVLDALGFELADVDEDGVTDIVTTRAGRLFVLLARAGGAFDARDLGVDMNGKTLRDFVVDPGPPRLYTLNELAACPDCTRNCSSRCVFSACVACLSDADCERGHCAGRACVP